MLDNIFFKILDMSVTSGIVILFVLAARLLLRKAPKIFSYALWAVVLFRLLCPFSFESVVSLLPEKSEPVTPEILYSQEFIPPPPAEDFENGFVPADDIPQGFDTPAVPEAPAEHEINVIQVLTFAGICLWLAGMIFLLIHSGVSLVKLKKRLENAVNTEGNVYISDRLETPFVIGFFRPRIYLPANLSEEENRYILLHEQTHIRRCDHIVKIVSYLALCVHWFNPLAWAAFFLSGKDMEMSCDEAVIKQLGGDVKKDYSSSLLALSTGKRIVGGSPLAFGEGSTKTRIMNVLNYKKPAFWVILVALIGVIALTVGLIANPVKKTVLPTDEEIDAVLKQFETVDGPNVRVKNIIAATEWAPFAVDINNDGVAEIGVAYDNYNMSEALFYERNGEEWRPFYTMYELPALNKNLNLTFDIEVYENEQGVVLHTTRINETPMGITYYYDVYTDFCGKTPQQYTPWYSVENGNATYYDADYDGAKEITKEEYDRLCESYISATALRETITVDPRWRMYSLKEYITGSKKLTITNTDEFPELGNINAGTAKYSKFKNELEFEITTNVGSTDTEEPPTGAEISFIFDVKNQNFDVTSIGGIPASEWETVKPSEDKLYEIALSLLKRMKINVETVDLSDIEGMNIGAEMPDILYCGYNRAILSGSFGVAVYDHYSGKISDRITFEKLSELGFERPYVTASPNGTKLYIAEYTFHQGKNPLYTYEYNVKKKTFKEIKPTDVKDVEIFMPSALGGTDGSDYKKYINSDCPTSWTKADISDTEFAYLRLKTGSTLISDLQLVLCDTEKGTSTVYNLWTYGDSFTVATDELVNKNIWNAPEKDGSEKLDFLILPDNELPAFSKHYSDSDSCEYGTYQNGELDALQLIKKLYDMKPLSFTEKEAEDKYVIFLLTNEERMIRDISMRYSVNDELPLREYPMDSEDFKRFKVPTEAGIYSFFADITWNDGETETAYFRVNVMNPPLVENRKYSIITDEVGSIGCEYAVDKDGKLGAKEMLLQLETMSGFSFTEYDVRNKYVQFFFGNEEKEQPESLSLRYSKAPADSTAGERISAEITDYPIEDSKYYRFRVPEEAGIYSFFADIVWKNGETETAYFRITVGSAGGKVSEETAKQSLLNVLTAIDRFDNEKLTLESSGVVNIGGTECYGFEERFKAGADDDRILNHYAVSTDGTQLYTFSQAFGQWEDFLPSENTTVAEFITKLRDSMIIEEKNGKFYAKMTVPEIFPKGLTADDIKIVFTADKGKTETPLMDDYADSYLKAGETYIQELKTAPDDKTVIYREIETDEYLITDHYRYGSDSKKATGVMSEIFNSLYFDKGTAKLSVPKKLPEELSEASLRTSVHLTYPDDGINAPKEETLFDDYGHIKAGMTYSDKLDAEISAGTTASIGMVISGENSYEASSLRKKHYIVPMVSVGEHTLDEAEEKVYDVLGEILPANEPEWKLYYGRECVINGEKAYAFNQIRTEGALVNTYAVTANFKKLYRAEYGNSPVVWQELKINLGEDNPTAVDSPLGFLDKLRDSMVIEEKNGGLYATMTVPEKFPAGYTSADLVADFSAAKRGGTGSAELLDSSQRSDNRYLKAGETYTKKIDMKLDGNVAVNRFVCFKPWLEYDYFLADSCMYSADNSAAQAFLEEIYNSISFKNNAVSFTIPKNVPAGISPKDLKPYVEVIVPSDEKSLKYPDGDGLKKDIITFEGQSFKAGGTYSQELFHKVTAGTTAKIKLDISGNDSVSASVESSYTFAEAPEAGGSSAVFNARNKIKSEITDVKWGFNRGLENARPCIIGGEFGYAFDSIYVDGSTECRYAVTADLKKLYRAEYDGKSPAWTEVNATAESELSPEAFLNQLRDSMVIKKKNNAFYAEITVPDVIPKGYDVEARSIDFYGGDINDIYGKNTLFFANHPQLSDGDYKLEAGKTYTQKLDDKIDKNTVLRRVVELGTIDAGNFYELRDDSLYNTSNEAEQAFLEEIYNSISVKNGKATITIPKNVPAGCSIEDLEVNLRLKYPDADSMGKYQYLFNDVKFRVGETYTEYLTRKLYNGTSLATELSITGGRFKPLDMDIAYIRARTYPAPEATFDKEARLLELAGENLSPILENVFDENNWILENGKKTTLDGKTAYTFDVRFKDEVPAMGGRLIGCYGISEDYSKVYKLDGISKKWILEYDLMKSTPELEKLVEEIYDSMTIENGIAKIVIPKKFPKGYSEKNLSIDFGVYYRDNGRINDNLFWNKEFEAGKTYTQKLKREIGDGTEVYRGVSIVVGNKSVIRKYETEEYPVREDGYTPKAEILTNGVEFTDKYGDTFKVTMNLPDGWSFKESNSPASVTVCKDGKEIGELSYGDFELYDNLNENNYRQAVYPGLFLGSVINWNTDYKVISKTENGSIDTCRPMRRESNGGLNPVETYSKGILSHDRTLLKNMAMSFDEKALTDEEWEALAKSVKLSGTKK